MIPDDFFLAPLPNKLKALSAISFFALQPI